MWRHAHYLAALVVEDADDADGHKFGARSAERATTEREDDGHRLLLRDDDDVVERLVKTACCQR